MAKDKRTGMKKIISRSITVLCLGVFFYAGYGLIDIAIEYYQNRQVLCDTKEMFDNGGSADESVQSREKSESGQVRPEFNELLKGNTDVAGWITIDGTQIDYPILNAADNVTYLD